jgi:hypothetical protein
VTAYRDSQDHLADELERLLLLLRAAVLELRRTPLPVRETSALAILDEEIDWHLGRPLRRAPPGPEEQALLAAVDRFAAVIAGRVAESEGEGDDAAAGAAGPPLRADARGAGCAGAGAGAGAGAALRADRRLPAR